MDTWAVNLLDYNMIRRCIAIEERASRFFEAISSQLSKEAVRQLLLEMASTSRKHADLLRSLYHGEERFNAYDLFDDNIIDIIEEVTKVQQEAERFYEKMLRDSSLTPDARIAFIELGYEEKKQREIIAMMVHLVACGKSNPRKILGLFGTSKDPSAILTSQT